APIAEGKRAAPPQPDKAKADAAADGANAARHPSSAGDWILLLLVVTGFFYSIPVLEVMHSPIAGLIYGFALWEAWKINKPVRLVSSGAFRLGALGGTKVKPEGAGDG